MKGIDLNTMRTSKLSEFSEIFEVNHVYRQARFRPGNGTHANEGFRRCVQTYNGNHKVKSCSCLDQLLMISKYQSEMREMTNQLHLFDLTLGH